MRQPLISLIAALIFTLFFFALLAAVDHASALSHPPVTGENYERSNG